MTSDPNKAAVLSVYPDAEAVRRTEPSRVYPGGTWGILRNRELNIYLFSADIGSEASAWRSAADELRAKGELPSPAPQQGT